MIDALKPCPFCGGEAGSCPDPNHPTGWEVGCFSGTCDIEPHVWAVHHATAVDQWNTRADLPPDADALVAVAWQMAANLADDKWGEGPNGSYDNGATSDGWDMATRAIFAAILAQTPATALAALSARDDAMRADGRRVKSLVWEKHPTRDIWRCDTFMGTYKVFGVGQVPSWDFDNIDDQISNIGGTTEICFAAAQDHYTAVIHAALLHPAPAQGVEG